MDRTSALLFVAVAAISCRGGQRVDKMNAALEAFGAEADEFLADPGASRLRRSGMRKVVRELVESDPAPAKDVLVYLSQGFFRSHIDECAAGNRRFARFDAWVLGRVLGVFVFALEAADPTGRERADLKSWARLVGKEPYLNARDPTNLRATDKEWKRRLEREYVEYRMSLGAGYVGAYSGELDVPE